MNQHAPDHIDLCAAWALGCLDQADRVRLDQHLVAGCRECEVAMADFSAATVLVAASAPSVVPAPALRQRVLAAATASSGNTAREAGTQTGPATAVRDGRAAVRDSAPERSRVVEFRPRPAWTVWAPLAAAAALAVTSGVLWMQTRKLATDLSSSRGQLAQLEQRMTEDRKWSAVLFSPDARVSVLEPTTDGDRRLRARATFDPTTKRAVVVFENFVKPSARDYELWVIRDGAPVSLGVIKADDSGHATMHLENVGDSFSLSAFAVSLEPQGGSPNPSAPSGPVVMLGKLSS